MLAILIALTPVGAICGYMVLFFIWFFLSLLPGDFQSIFSRNTLEPSPYVVRRVEERKKAKHFDSAGNFSGTTTADGKSFDAAGNYAGKTTADGKQYDAAGAYAGKTTEDGKHYDAAGKYAGQTVDGKRYDESGKYAGGDQA